MRMRAASTRRRASIDSSASPRRAECDEMPIMRARSQEGADGDA